MGLQGVSKGSSLCKPTSSHRWLEERLALSTKLDFTQWNHLLLTQVARKGWSLTLQEVPTRELTLRETTQMNLWKACRWTKHINQHDWTLNWLSASHGEAATQTRTTRVWSLLTSICSLIPSTASVHPKLIGVRSLVMEQQLLSHLVWFRPTVAQMQNWLFESNCTRWKTAWTSSSSSASNN